MTPNATDTTLGTAPESPWASVFRIGVIATLAVQLALVVDLSNTLRAINRTMPASVPDRPEWQVVSLGNKNALAGP